MKRFPTNRELGLMGASGELSKKIFGAYNTEGESALEEMKEQFEESNYLGEVISPSDIVDAIYSSSGNLTDEIKTNKLQWIAEKIQSAEEEKDEWDWLNKTGGETEEGEEESEMMSPGEDWSFLDSSFSDDENFLGEEENKSLINSVVKRSRGNVGKTPESDHSGTIQTADKRIKTPSVGRSYVDVKLDKDKWEVNGNVIDEEELEQE